MNIKPKQCTISGRPPDGVTEGAPQPIDPATGQHKDYYILCDEERAKRFVRPVRRTYIHDPRPRSWQGSRRRARAGTISTPSPVSQSPMASYGSYELDCASLCVS
jgi:hypothetical protein